MSGSPSKAEQEQMYARALRLAETDQAAAIAGLRELLRHAPSHAYALNDLGTLLAGAGDYRAAQEHLLEAAVFQPDDLDILRNLGELYLLQQSYPKALPIFERLHRLAPENTNTLFTLAELYLAAQRVDEARAAYERLLRIDPQHELAQAALRELGAALRLSLEPPTQEVRATPIFAPVSTPVSAGAAAAPTAIDPKRLAQIRQWEQHHALETRKVSSRAAALLPEGGVLIDIGANVGVFTEQVLESKRCRAYLFEPVPQYCAYAQDKFQHRSEVTVENLALSDAPGSLRLWIDHQNLGWNTLVAEKTTSGMQEITVPAVTFDEYAAQHGIDRIDVIKIDVEGGEFKVLRGMQQTLRRLKKKPYILCEIGWGASHPNWKEECEAFEWLFENGYERVDYQVSMTTDVLFTPKAQATTQVAIVEAAPAEDLPFITLGIPTRNRVESLLRLLDSVAKQRYPHFEVLVSDDGHTPQLDELIKSSFPALRIRFLQGPGRSLPSNRQHIMDHARTELVVMCDDDHVMDPDCLAQLVQAARSSLDIGIVCAIWPHPLENPPTVRYEEVRRVDEYSLTLDGIRKGSDFWWKTGCELFKAYHKDSQLIEAEFAGGGCLLYRKSAVLAAGGFPDDYSVVSFREDTDMSHRVFLQGRRIVVNPRAIAYHLREEQGGCKDSPEWARNFVRDGLSFLEKLEIWREERQQRSDRPLRVLVFYDTPGWAWWHRAHHLKRWLAPSVQVDIAQAGARVQHENYDFILLFDHYLLEGVGPIPSEKTVIANSCPKLLPDMVKAIEAGLAVGGFVNNYRAFMQVRHDPRFFCCQNGVDLDLFTPGTPPSGPLIACWTGNSKSIGNKGLDLIREACTLAGVDLLVADAATIPEGTPANSQEWVRDNLYRRASVYICASEFEGTPNPALEALACGLPVITTAVGNMPELIVDGHNGFIVERSAEAIAEAIRKLQRLDRSVLARNARRTVEPYWSWQEQAKKYIEMFTELDRRRRFGKKLPRQIAEEEVEAVVQERMQDYLPLPAPESYIRSREGRYTFLDASVAPQSPERRLLMGTVNFLSQQPPFYLHIGGTGDALLLLSTFFDKNPQQRIVSVPLSFESAKAFYDLFPELTEVLFVPFPNDIGHRLLSIIAAKLPNCLGMGITPAEDHVREWSDGIDIFRKYGVTENPRWVERFRGPKRLPVQVTLAPKGSTVAMAAEKRNVIDPAVWPALVRLFTDAGIRPIVLGVPSEAAMYPLLPGCIDGRSYDFREQMELIAGSDLLVAADSWAKTFAGLCSVQTLVFRPLLTGRLVGWKDPGENVFIRPWPTLTAVESLDEVRMQLSRLMPQLRPASQFGAPLL